MTSRAVVAYIGMRVITTSPYRQCLGAKGDFGHFRSSKQHADVCVRLARCDFLLVFYRYSDLGLDETVVEL